MASYIMSRICSNCFENSFDDCYLYLLDSSYLLTKELANFVPSLISLLLITIKEYYEQKITKYGKTEEFVILDVGSF
jgi:hypothetical protein